MGLTTGTKISIPNKDRSGRVVGNGIKSIGFLRVGDQIVSYSSKDSYFTNLSGGDVSKVESITACTYRGQMYRIICDNKTSISTSDQRWLVRFNNLAEGRYVVYLMQRDDKFRIGCCRLMYDGGFGVSMRARQEKADQAWILSVHEHKIDAMVQEQVIGFKYGIPDRIFEHAMQTPSMNMNHQEYSVFVREFWNKYQTDYTKVLQCLKIFGRHIKEPIWSAYNNAHVGRYSFVAPACNLLSEVMSMRTFEGKKKGGSWKPIVVSNNYADIEIFFIRITPSLISEHRRLCVLDSMVAHDNSI